MHDLVDLVLLQVACCWQQLLVLLVLTCSSPGCTVAACSMHATLMHVRCPLPWLYPNGMPTPTSGICQRTPQCHRLLHLTVLDFLLATLGQRSFCGTRQALQQQGSPAAPCQCITP